MAKTALSETQSETTEITSASGDIIEGSPTASLTIAPGAGLVGDFDASDISFPKLQIAQGVGALSETYKKGTIVLDGETEISNGEDEVEVQSAESVRCSRKTSSGTAGNPSHLQYQGRKCSKLIPKQPSYGRMVLQLAGNQSLMHWFVLREMIQPTSHLNSMVGTMHSRSGESRTAYKHAAVPIFTAAKMYYRDGINVGSFQLSTQKVKAGNNVVHAPKLRKGARHDAKFVEWLKDFS